MSESRKNKKPEIIVFAGPNGSGKSTITKLLKPPQMRYINADDIKRVVHCDDLTAAQTAEHQREQCIENRKDFCFGTVLSTERNINLLKRAREAGYFIRCFYVLTFDPIINITRVKSRFASGGHDVPEAKIVSRYDRALSLVETLIPLCDVCHIYDNSFDKPYRIFKKRKDKMWYCELPDFWNYADIQTLTGIIEMTPGELNNTDE